MENQELISATIKQLFTLLIDELKTEIQSEVAIAIEESFQKLALSAQRQKGNEPLGFESSLTTQQIDVLFELLKVEHIDKRTQKQDFHSVFNHQPLPAEFNKIRWVLKSPKSKELNKKELLRLFLFLKENRFIDVLTDAQLYNAVNNCFATDEGNDINIKSRNKPSPFENPKLKLDFKKLLLLNS